MKYAKGETVTKDFGQCKHCGAIKWRVLECYVTVDLDIDCEVYNVQCIEVYRDKDGVADTDGEICEYRKTVTQYAPYARELEPEWSRAD